MAYRYGAPGQNPCPAREFLEEIIAALSAGQYHPSPVKRRYIPKTDGKQRPLGIQLALELSYFAVGGVGRFQRALAFTS